MYTFSLYRPVIDSFGRVEYDRYEQSELVNLPTARFLGEHRLLETGFNGFLMVIEEQNQLGEIFTIETYKMINNRIEGVA